MSEPLLGISKMAEYKDITFYRVHCECQNPDDSIDFNIEFNPDIGMVTMHTEVKSKTDWYTSYFEEFNSDIENEWLYEIRYNIAAFLNGLIRRVKLTWGIWVHGYVEYNTYTLLREEAAINYANAILNSIKKLKKKNK